jgi:flagellar basal-body rod protein FlgB
MSNIGLMNAISAKIDYLARRQEVVSQNIANADTSGYKPKDLTEIDFGQLIGPKTPTESPKLGMATTNAEHLLAGGVKPGAAKNTQQPTTYEVAPDGNAVIVEEQLVKANQLKMDYDLMVNLYQKNMNMMRIALGTSR